MPIGLKITNRYKVTLYDSTWIPGVDFNDSNYEDDNSSYSNYEYDTQSSTTDTTNNDEDDSNEDDSDPDDDDYDDDENKDHDEMKQNYDELLQHGQHRQEGSEEDDDDDDEPGNTTQPKAFPEANIGNDNNKANPNRVEELRVTEETQQDENEEIETQNGSEDDEDDRDPQEYPVNQDNVLPQNATTTRSGRVSKPPSKFGDYYMHLQTQTHPTERTMEYTTQEGRVIAKVLEYMLFMQVHPEKKKARQFMQRYGMNRSHKEVQMVQSYSLKSGLKKFGNRGKESTAKEMKQLDDREVFYPINVDELTEKERKRAMESLLFLVEKRDGKVKA